MDKLGLEIEESMSSMDDDDEEAVGLISSECSDFDNRRLRGFSGGGARTLHPLEKGVRTTRRREKLMILLVLLSLLGISMIAIGKRTKMPIAAADSVVKVVNNGAVAKIDRGENGRTTDCVGEVTNNSVIVKMDRDENGIDRFRCPTVDPCAANDYRLQANNSYQSQFYDSISRRINVTEYMSVFRNTEFDQSGKSYEEFKSVMRLWKSKYFLNLADNSSIYESGFGIGMNLYMTLEILAETPGGAKNLVVYGNDYSLESVRVATEIAQFRRHHQKDETIDNSNSGVLPGGGRLGTFCAGDSTNLYFVPSNSFDAVFSGYLTPLPDPLSLNVTSASNTETRYVELCESNDTDSIKLSARAQRIQEKWYAAWVEEMIRIAKPGGIIMVEHVSLPLCYALYDWGGVAPDFWKKSVQKFDWNVDPESIEIVVDHLARRRYHVFMRKKENKKHQHRNEKNDKKDKNKTMPTDVTDPCPPVNAACNRMDKPIICDYDGHKCSYPNPSCAVAAGLWPPDECEDDTNENEKHRQRNKKNDNKKDENMTSAP